MKLTTREHAIWAAAYAVNLYSSGVPPMPSLPRDATKEEIRLLIELHTSNVQRRAIALANEEVQDLRDLLARSENNEERETIASALGVDLQTTGPYR